jgi:hypothetical protein
MSSVMAITLSFVERLIHKWAETSAPWVEESGHSLEMAARLDRPKAIYTSNRELIVVAITPIFSATTLFSPQSFVLSSSAFAATGF